MAFDSASKRIYFAASQFIDVFQQRDPDHYERIATVPTSPIAASTEPATNMDINFRIVVLLRCLPSSVTGDLARAQFSSFADARRSARARARRRG